MNWTVPALGGIQRTSALLVLAAAAVLAGFASLHAAIGCLIGGALMIANLYLLAIIGRTILGLAQNGGAGLVGVALAPFKLMLFAVAVYLLITRLNLDLIGFTIGATTQLLAVIVETGRVSLGAAQIRMEEPGV